ncbi:MAG: nucleotide kinase [Clostridiales bacterium]|nr:nucleotide kinase [Clostridiales bacterium]
MKTLYFIGGPMGVGKTTVGRELLHRLPRCAFLDGDWCWTMQPFIVTDETKAMVIDNIAHTLGNFLRCSEYEHIVFCWVMHQQEIIDRLLTRLPMEGVRFVNITLLCSPEELSHRIGRDVSARLRDEGALTRALSYLPLYEAVQSVKLDTTGLTPASAAGQIIHTGDPL